MNLGLHIVDYTWPGGPARIGLTLAEQARTAEAVGFDAIAVADHVWQSPYIGGPEREMLEAYTTLGYLAARTSRVRLLTLVTGAHFRHPGMLAKTVTTLDVLSGGRAWLGIGAGHDEAEAQGLGIPLPPMAERFERLEETVRICLRMWEGERGDGFPFLGEHFRLGRLLNLPQSLTRPHPPLMIGGGGERRTLRLVARHADACNLYPTPDLPRKLDVLRRHCEAEGRDDDAIEKTCVFRFDVGEDGAKAGEMVGPLRGLAKAGIQMVYLQVQPAGHLAPLEAIGREVIPAVADL